MDAAQVVLPLPPSLTCYTLQLRPAGKHLLHCCYVIACLYNPNHERSCVVVGWLYACGAHSKPRLSCAAYGIVSRSTKNSCASKVHPQALLVATAWQTLGSPLQHQA